MVAGEFLIEAHCACCEFSFRENGVDMACLMATMQATMARHFSVHHPDKFVKRSDKRLAEYRRQWKTNNPELVRAEKHRYFERHKEERHEYAHGFEKSHPRYRLDWRRKLRAQVLALYGSKCAICGFVDSRALQLDHINGAGKKHRSRLGTSNFYRVVLKDPKHYQLLCANCNWIKSYVNHERPFRED